MYLANILLENSGPITSLDVSLPFNADGSPKPLVVVGTNGSGKTIGC
jgi:signal recognition particle GTPase